jgi:hypothetical protein
MIIKIELIIMNKLELVKEISIPFIDKEGPIL